MGNNYCANAYASRTVIIGLRPQDLPAAADGHIGPALAGDVDLVEALGAELMVHFTIDARRFRRRRRLTPPPRPPLERPIWADSALAGPPTILEQ